MSSPSREPLQRLVLEERVVARDVVEHAGLEHEEAAVHPGAVAGRLLGERGHRRCSSSSSSAPKRPSGLHGGHRRQAPVGAMKGEQRRDVDVGDAVAVGQQERLVAEILGHALHAPAGLRVGAGVDQRHAPGLDLAVVDLDRPAPEVERDVGAVQEVVGEVLLDDVALVAQADRRSR